MTSSSSTAEGIVMYDLECAILYAREYRQPAHVAYSHVTSRKQMQIGSACSSGHSSCIALASDGCVCRMRCDSDKHLGLFVSSTFSVCAQLVMITQLVALACCVNRLDCGYAADSLLPSQG